MSDGTLQHTRLDGIVDYIAALDTLCKLAHHNLYLFELLAKLFSKRSVMTFNARISASKWLRFPFLRQSFRFTAIFRP